MPRSVPPAAPSHFGDTAVRLGYIDDHQLRDALAEQSRRREGGRASGPIGALLLEQGLLSPSQITAVLRQLAGGELPLSEDGIRLAARLKVVHATPGNVIGISGSDPRDCARTTAELAVALAVMEQGLVVAVDTQVREPLLHTLLGAPAAPGLLEAVAHQPVAPLPTRVAALGLMPAGQPMGDAVAACMSPEAGDVIERLRTRHRYVLVNLGPITRHPEAAVGASRCDGVLLVLRGGLSRKDELRDMARMLTGLKVGLSGVVIARAATRRERRRA